MKIKQQLFESIARLCVQEVLNNLSLRNASKLREADEPSSNDSAQNAGQASDEQPSMDNKPDTTPSEPSDKEAPTPKKEKDTSSGVWFVNPKDKSVLQKVVATASDDASLERKLYSFTSKNYGPKVKVSLGAFRDIKNGLKDPSSPTFLYIGKLDPDSEEIFLLADKSLQVAKDETVDAETSYDYSKGSDFDPNTAEGDEFAKRMQSAGKSDVAELPDDSDDFASQMDESLKASIKKLIRKELLKK